MNEVAGKTEPDPNTGWWRVDVYEGDGDYMFGDDTDERELVGTPYSSEYTDGVYKSRCYYAVFSVIDGDSEPAEKRYVVDGMTETWKIKLDENGEDIGNDNAEYDYDGGSALYYDTLEAAQKECRRFAMNDESFAYYSPKENA